MINLSRISEELIIWNTEEFNFINIPDEFTTGSSIMPQKRNPDYFELIRGKSGIPIGHLVSLLTSIEICKKIEKEQWTQLKLFLNPLKFSQIYFLI